MGAALAGWSVEMQKQRNLRMLRSENGQDLVRQDWRVPGGSGDGSGGGVKDENAKESGLGNCVHPKGDMGL